jgi:hypothetical protein
MILCTANMPTYRELRTGTKRESPTSRLMDGFAFDPDNKFGIGADRAEIIVKKTVARTPWFFTQDVVERRVLPRTEKTADDGHWNRLGH